MAETTETKAPEEKKPPVSEEDKYKLPLLSNVHEYTLLYNYNEVVSQLIAKRSPLYEALRGVAKNKADFDSKLTKISSINEIIAENAGLAGLGGVSRRKIDNISRYWNQVRVLKKKNILSAEDIDELMAEYDHSNARRSTANLNSLAAATDKDHVRKLKKEHRKKGRALFGNIMLLTVGGLGLLAGTAGVATGLWQVITTALAGSFGLASGFGVVGIMSLVLLAKPIVNGLGKFFKWAWGRVMKSRAERKATAQALRDNKRLIKDLQRERRLIDRSYAADMAYSAYPGRRLYTAPTRTMDSEYGLDMVTPAMTADARRALGYEVDPAMSVGVPVIEHEDEDEADKVLDFKDEKDEAETPTSSETKKEEIKETKTPVIPEASEPDEAEEKRSAEEIRDKEESEKKRIGEEEKAKEESEKAKEIEETKAREGEKTKAEAERVAREKAEAEAKKLEEEESKRKVEESSKKPIEVESATSDAEAIFEDQFKNKTTGKYYKDKKAIERASVRFVDSYMEKNPKATEEEARKVLEELKASKIGETKTTEAPKVKKEVKKAKVDSAEAEKNETNKAPKEETIPETPSPVEKVEEEAKIENQKVEKEADNMVRIEGQNGNVMRIPEEKYQEMMEFVESQAKAGVKRPEIVNALKKQYGNDPDITLDYGAGSAFSKVYYEQIVARHEEQTASENKIIDEPAITKEEKYSDNEEANEQWSLVKSNVEEALAHMSPDQIEKLDESFALRSLRDLGLEKTNQANRALYAKEIMNLINNAKSANKSSSLETDEPEPEA